MNQNDEQENEAYPYPYSSSHKTVENSSRYKQANQQSQPSKPISQQWRELDLGKRIESIVGCIGVFVAIVLAVVAYFQLSAMREQSFVMNGQLDVMRKQLTAENRPWLDTEITVVEPLAFHEDYAQVGISIRVKNGGKGPSIKMKSAFSLMLIGATDDPIRDAMDRPNPIIERQNASCAPDRIFDPKYWPTIGRQLLLPNSETIIPTWKLQDNTPVSSFKNGEIGAMVITGCLLYADESGGKHATLTTLLYMGTYPFKPVPGLIPKSGGWGLHSYGQGAY